MLRRETAPVFQSERYRVLGALGEGGMARVLRVYDTRLDVERAIKILTAASLRNDQARGRFEAEARTMAKLSHPHVVTVFDVDRAGETTFIVMELLEGGSLRDRLDSGGAMAPRAAVEALLPILSALQFAHDRGIIHRDLKPANILLTADGAPRLADFGIAHIAGGGSGALLTRTGVAMGTWAFMAPEQQVDAARVDGRADLYALGASIGGCHPHMGGWAHGASRVVGWRTVLRLGENW